jgi:hypothetical protein
MIYLLNSDNSGIYTHSTTNGLLTTNLSNGIFYVNGIQSRTLIANSWNHIAVTTNVALTSLAFKLGTARNAASAAFFTGLLDEVRLSSVARSAEEIRLNAQRRPYAVYTSPLIDLTQKAGAWNSLSWTESGVATGDGETLSSGTSLVAQWNFNQSLGTTLTNSAGASSCAGTPANCDITLAGIGATNSQDEAPEMGFTSNARWGGGAFNISNNPTTALFHFDGTDTATTNFTNEIGGTLVRAGNAQTDTAQSKFGGASALFDGTGDSLTSSSSTLWQLDDGANTTNFTIDGWIRMPALQDGGIVGQALDGNDFWAIQYRLSQNAIRFRIQSAGSNIVTNDFSWVASTNTWYHLAVVKVGTTYTTYINGSSIGAFADVDVMPTWTAPLVFGTANANDFNGWLDEFRISKGIARWTSAFTPPVNPYYSSISNPASNALDPSDNFSIETWVKASENNITLMSNNNSNKDICTENGYYLGIGASGNPIFNVDVNGATAGCEATITGNNYISDGNWHFVVATFDKPNSLAKLYVDGVLVGSDTSVATSITSVTSSIFFGADGVITDSTRFYSRTLTAGEILSNYNSGNIEIQTRVGSSTDPNDGTWEAWRPTTSETSIDNFDSGSSWFWDLGIGGTDGRSALYMPKTISTDSIIKTEGSASQKLNIGGAQLDSNTTGLWHLDETSGTSAYIKDISGNNTSCTPYGTVVTNGIFGKARWFDGSVSTNYVNCTTINAALKTSDITLQAWIKTNTVDTSGSHIFTIGYGAMISLTSTGQARAQIFNGTVYQSATGPTIITDNNWHHVAGVFDNTNNLLKIYVDGVFESSIGSTETISYGNNMAIGRNVGSTAYDFTGTIDEIKVSGIALSDEEIAQSFQNGRNHRLSQTISSTDLSSLSKIPFSIASDRPGTILQATIGESPFVNYEPDSNTVGLWHLDENDTGTTASPTAFFIDSALSNNATPGTGTSFPAQTTGKIGQGRFFDGTNDYITASNINIGNSSFTLSAWAKVNIGTSNMTIVSIGNTNATNQNVNMNIRSTGVFRFSFYSNDLDTTTTFSDTDWHLWTCTFDANSKVRKIYRDGVLQISDVSASNFTGGGVLNIGRLLSASNLSFFNGSIDEVRVDNVVRTADEIRQAYEVGLRSHPITIDFAASLVSSNLIIDSSDYSFNINAISFGLGSSGANLYLGDKIIIKENIGGTEYLAQGTVNSVNSSTGAITVSSWDAGSTFFGTGFTSNATVFKWQTEYFDITGSLPSHRNAITRLTLRFSNGNEGRSIWLDDLKSAGSYLTNSIGSTITSSLANRYFQYRSIFSTTDYNVSPSLSSLTLDYVENTPPLTPTLVSPGNGTTAITITPSLVTVTTDANASLDYLQYKINLCTDSAMTTDCSVFDQTVSNTNWSGQDIGTSAYSSGTTATYSIQTTLTANTTYYWKSLAIDPNGTNTWGNTQSTPFSFTTFFLPSASNCRILENDNKSVFTLNWADNANNEEGYDVQRSANNGAWTNFQTGLSVGTTGITDSTILPGGNYIYRVAPYKETYYAPWCSTVSLSIGNTTNSFKFDGLKMDGLKIN